MNPTDNPDLALQYIESIDTQKGDTVWRYMPDLMDVAAFSDFELPTIVKPDNTLKYTSLDVSKTFFSRTVTKFPSPFLCRWQRISVI